MIAYDIKPNDNKDDNRIGYIVLIMMAILAAILLASCSRKVMLSKVDTKTEIYTDTVHVIKYDTSITIHQDSSYQMKIVEVYDTIITPKDSIINVLKTRTTYSSGTQSKTEVKAGKGYDSSSGKSGTKTEIIYKDKIVEKKSSIWWIILSCIATGLLGFWLGKTPPAKVINEVESAYNIYKKKFL